MKVPFRVAIVTLVVGLLIATAGTLTFYGFRESFEDVQHLRRAYLEQAAHAAALEVARLPRLAERALRAQRGVADLGHFPSTDEPRVLARFLAAVLAEAAELTWLSYGEEQSGRFVGAMRPASGEIVVNLSDPAVDHGVPRELRVGVGGRLEPVVRASPLPAYDPRARAWYRAARERPDGVVWMPPYVFANGGRGITAALAVRAGDGVRGVLTADFSLQGLDEVLRRWKVTRRGTILLTTTAGEVLAGEGGAARDALIRALHADQWHDELGARTPFRRAEVSVEGLLYDVVVSPLIAIPGLGWMVAIVVPDDDFMGPVYQNRRRAMLIAALGLVVAAALGALVSKRIVRSLDSVVGTLDRMAHFVVEPRVGPTSRLKEIALVQEAIDRMNASLRSFTRYAPEEIVREVIVSGREVMLSGEEREVTLLFCDLRGFTGLAERMAPEEVVAVLNDHLDALSAVVARHGGYVVDFLGDSLFTVFGAPRAFDDHAARAVACAIEMQEVRGARNAEYRGRRWPPLEMGVGINGGLAVVGNMGSHLRIKYGVVGHPVNLAARIESFAVAGQVLVSDATRLALADRLVVQGPFEAEAKGVGSVIRTWEVRGLGDQPRIVPQGRATAPLARPVDARLRLIHHKHLEADAHPARILGLGPTSAEVACHATTTTPLDSVQLLFSWPDGGPAILGGKVVEISERAMLIRLEGLGWDTRSRLEALARAPSQA